MNGAIWAKPIVQQHVATLRARGDTVVAPVEGTPFEIWRGAQHVGVSMPGPDEAAPIVRDWLRSDPHPWPASDASSAPRAR
jgi:hypothetical protein